MRLPIRRTTLGLLGAIAAVTAIWNATDTQASPTQASLRYEVTITNVTRGQIFSPALVVSHTMNTSLFELGQRANSALALRAEEGDNSMLLQSLGQNPDVLDSRSDTGPLMPGASTTVTVASEPGLGLISVAGMLVSTNDAFYSVRAIPLPQSVPITVFARAYDAGTEANSEDCAFIPGPPCGNAVHDPSPAEGYVFVHAGVHGLASLDAAERDWRDVVAQITIERKVP